MAITGTRYILEHKDQRADEVLSATERFPAHIFALVWENERWRIWEYTQALPRVFVVHNTVVESSPQAIVDILLSEQTNLRTRAVVEDEVAYMKGPENSESSAEIVQYDPMAVSVLVNTDAPGLLLLSDSYYPGWRAYIDGIEAKIYRSNFAFRGVLVSPGNHTVRFVYDPLSWKVGVLVSGLGLVTFIVFVSMIKRRHA